MASEERVDDDPIYLRTSHSYRSDDAKPVLGGEFVHFRRYVVIWLVVSTPLKNMKVSWEPVMIAWVYIPTMLLPHGPVGMTAWTVFGLIQDLEDGHPWPFS